MNKFSELFIFSCIQTWNITMQFYLRNLCYFFVFSRVYLYCNNNIWQGFHKVLGKQDYLHLYWIMSCFCCFVVCLCLIIIIVFVGWKGEYVESNKTMWKEISVEVLFVFIVSTCLSYIMGENYTNNNKSY